MPSFLLSLGIHGALFAAAAWLVIGGQGNDGDIGMETEDADAGFVAQFRPLPKPEPQVFKITPHRTRSFTPANMPRVLATTNQAEITLPKWEMQPMKPIEAPAPAPEVRKAEATPTPSNDVAQDTPPAKKSAAKASRAAPGKGATGGMGSATIAAAQPRIVSSYPPSYPSAARRAHVEGTATIKVSLTSKGRVANCSIYRSAGNEDLDTAALRAVRGWRFTETSDGTEVLVTVKFRLS